MVELNINTTYSRKSNSCADVDKGKLNHRFSQRLEPSLSPMESWGFGLSGLLLWLGTAPSMHAELGPKAIFVWLPGAIVGIMLNLQIKRLGIQWPKVSGGTPNYTTRLLKSYPGLARYAAIGYLLGWVSVPPMNAIILTDLIEATLSPLGISCPVTLLRIGFTLLPFLVAFSGTRALGILHSCFVFPAIGLLLAFSIQGIGWLSLASSSPGFFPSIGLEIQNLPPLNFVEWAKWFFIAVYAVYGCETASSFVADSKNSRVTLRCLDFAAWLIVPVYLGGSWVLMRLANADEIGNNAFLNLVGAAKPFWGESASFLVTFLIACGCLLSSATAVSNSPRILYQLAIDGYISPVFAVVSRRGVFGPGLTFTLLLNLVCLMWGDVDRVVMIAGTGYLFSMLAIHLGLWLGRGRSAVLWPWWSGGFFVVEAIVLVVGGLAWNWKYLAIGLLLPIAILAADAAVLRLKFAPFHPSWWKERHRAASQERKTDFVLVQVGVLIFLICSATAIGWTARAKLDTASVENYTNVFVLLLLISAFVGVAIACWTSLPQVTSIIEAREQAEYLFKIALDAIIVLDENCVILQANPATELLFGVKNEYLLGNRLNQILLDLPDVPERWPSRSEQIVTRGDGKSRFLEVAISGRNNQERQEYVVLLRDITKRKQTEAELRQALQIKEELAATATAQAQQLERTLRQLQQTQAQLIQSEKMSSLSQLVGGIAHEINNPINFIYGNIQYAKQYAQDLLYLLNLYKYYYPNPVPELQVEIEDKEVDFLVEDFPKLLDSMKVGADRIRDIVLSLRNFSRLDEAEKKRVDIHEGIESALMFLHNRLKAKGDYPGIQVIKEYGDVPKIECYAGQINQVFMNLLCNAIDSINEYNKQRSLAEIKACQGTIAIRTFVKENNRLFIRIADNGLGIADDVQRKLFDPFFTTKPIGQGTGMGLAISYQIVVRKHGGKLHCISEPGKGAEFVIEIPICS
ncbi:ATP-binding protein [Aerosakkonema sp. BLCC-F183]|uniref:ATP-binding protein n=1 Tax=Aerosakkonema sp. BLCC-F183 TaxID=3342834 RepID=UPI0035B7745B